MDDEQAGTDSFDRALAKGREQIARWRRCADGLERDLNQTEANVAEAERLAGR